MTIKTTKPVTTSFKLGQNPLAAGIFAGDNGFDAKDSVRCADAILAAVQDKEQIAPQ